MSAFAVGILMAMAVLAVAPARPQRVASADASDRSAGHAGRKPRSMRRSGLAGGAGQAQSHHCALVMELLAAALRAGSPVPSALRAVAGATAGPESAALLRAACRMELGAPAGAAWVDCPAGVAELKRVLVLVESAGVPAEGLLRSAAADLRRRAARESEAAAARLGVRLVLPLGLCALPAFIAWSVAPVVLSLAEAFG